MTSFTSRIRAKAFELQALGFGTASWRVRKHPDGKWSLTNKKGQWFGTEENFMRKFDELLAEARTATLEAASRSPHQQPPLDIQE